MVVFIGTETAQKIDFNFPENFEGKAIVVQQIACGQEVVMKNGREQLNFPENGILLYQGKIEGGGYRNYRFYYTTKAGNKTEIPQINIYYAFEGDSIPIDRRFQIGVYYKGTIMEPPSPPSGVPDYKFAEMFVSSVGNLENLLNIEYKSQVDSLKYEVIKRCR